MNKKIIQKITESRKNLVIFILSIIAIMIVIFLVSAFFYIQNFMNAKNSSDKKQIDFVVTRGEGVRKIAKDLENKGLIKNDIPFLIYLKYQGLIGDLESGEYLIPADMSPLNIVDIISNGRVASLTITIPEGWSDQQIANYLASRHIVSADDFMKATKENYSYNFLADKPANSSLEGYLFPDTYEISRKATAEDIIKKMLDNFGKKYSAQTVDEIQTTGMTEYQVLTLASIVEKEVATPEDRKVIAGIFLTRLKDSIPLQSDVTLQYFLGENIKEFTIAQTETPSPYNTYLNKGLPIGPICNPSMESIEAVIYPQYTDYQYFISANGITYYAKTLAEQTANEAKYLTN